MLSPYACAIIKCITATEAIFVKSAEERFFAKVVKQEGCWEWSAAKDRGGYGIFRLSPTISRVKAHRFAWELQNGEIPEGMFVCHHCDNPECTNPDHLFLGTPKDNMDDKLRKGRWRGGLPAHLSAVTRERPHKAMSKLEPHVDAITEMRDKGCSLYKIAADFGCDVGVVRRVLEKFGRYRPLRRGPRGVYNARTDAIRERTSEILQRRSANESILSIARDLGASRHTVSKIVQISTIRT